MKTKLFLSRLDHEKIVAAIAEAEKRTSGEIRVFVSHRKVEDALKAATFHFSKMDMHKTKHRNAVLIFGARPLRVAPSRELSCKEPSLRRTNWT